MSEEKLRVQIAEIISPGFMLWFGTSEGALRKAAQILSLIKQAGYLPVEPVLLEVLEDEEIHRIYMEAEIPRAGYVENCKAIMKATVQAAIVHNETKFGKLYRRST